jgi:hypothetical protein
LTCAMQAQTVVQSKMVKNQNFVCTNAIRIKRNANIGPVRKILEESIVLRLDSAEAELRSSDSAWERYSLRRRNGRNRSLFHEWDTSCAMSPDRDIISKCLSDQQNAEPVLQS